MAYKEKKLLSKRCNYGNKRSLKDIKYLVYHYTANDGDTDEANANYFHNNNVGASAHIFVDDDSITVSVPHNYVAWAVGSYGLLDQGSPYRDKGHKFWGKCTNNNSLSIEMCDTKRDGKHNLSAKTRQNAIDYGAKQMIKYNIPISRVIRHFDVNGKLCPIFWVTNEADWLKFKKELQERVKALKSGNAVQITAKSLNIRKEADIKSKIIDVAEEGDIFVISKKVVKGGITWGKLKGREGYISLSPKYSKKL